MLALLVMAVTGAVAQTTYKVSLKEGTEDATSWQGKAGEGGDTPSGVGLNPDLQDETVNNGWSRMSS